MKKDKTPSYIKVGIFTVVTTLAWIFFSVYRILTTKPAPNVASQILAPFNPTLDLEKIEDMETRIYFEEGVSPLFIIEEVSPEASPTPETTPVPEDSLSPTESPIPEESSIPEELPI